MFKKFSENLSGAIKSISLSIAKKEVSKEDLEEIFSDLELIFLKNDVAVEVIEDIFKEVKKGLLGKKVNRLKVETIIKERIRSVLGKILYQDDLNLEKIIKEKDPVLILFIGSNGAGKSLSIAKLAKYLKEKGYKPLIAAGDTYRAAGIVQIEEYAKDINIPVVKHKRGGDPAAVIYDAKKKAESQKYDVILADTAGRSHIDHNLLEELKKISRVNSPDLTILVLDTLLGNDIVSQCKKFKQVINIDGLIFTKLDSNNRGGSIISATHILDLPTLFVGTGQGYENLKEFDPTWLINKILREKQ